MLQKAAMTFGIVLVAIGLLGFVPPLTPDGHLLGIFHVDAIHNIIHLTSGAAALLAASSATYSRLYFQIFGIVYGLVAVAGFIPGLVMDEKLFGLFSVNLADNLLHIAIAASSLYLGFMHLDTARTANA